MSIVNDNITEDSEMFRATLSLDDDDPADFVTVLTDEAIVTIEDNDGRQYLCCSLIISTTSSNVLAVLGMCYHSNKV